jgi:hypothetical protein
VRRQPGASPQQQQWAGAAAAGSSGYAASKMDVDIGSVGVSRSSSRPQSPLTRASACGATGPYGLSNPMWREASRDAAAAASSGLGSSGSSQPLQGQKPAAGGGANRWGAGLGLASGLSSPQAGSPGAGGRGSVKAPSWGALDGGSGGSSHTGHSSFGVAANTWSEDSAAAAMAAAATLCAQSGLGPACTISTRPSLAAALPVFGDALSGMQASGGPAPVSMGLYGRSSIVGPQPPGMAGGAAAAVVGAAAVGRYPGPSGLQLETDSGRVSLAGGGGIMPQAGYQQPQQQHSPPHQPYLHQHLYH